MVEVVYIEDAVRDHPRVRAICDRIPGASRVSCTRWGEVFNRRGQSFRLEKQRPSLILAAKHGELVLKTPEGYGIGSTRNYYFSHMLNCVYDCRYCFLQGMFRSAHYVVFVNYEDFEREIEDHASASEEPAYFFSGYDCDSLAFEPVTRFARRFVALFDSLDSAVLELRTKSLQIRPLLERDAIPNVVVAFSLTPDVVARALENGVPTVERRIDAAARLQERGWKIGLRFDPLIDHEMFEASYRQLFRDVFARIRGDFVHSVSFGPFRLPRGYFKTLSRLYPEEPLFAGALENRGGMTSYPEEREQAMIEFASRTLLEYIPADVFYPLQL